MGGWNKFSLYGWFWPIEDSFTVKAWKLVDALTYNDSFINGNNRFCPALYSL